MADTFGVYGDRAERGIEPLEDTSEWRNFLRAATAVTRELESIYNSPRMRMNRGQFHRVNHIERCDVRRDSTGLMSGTCGCRDELQSLTAETLSIIHARFVKDAHHTPDKGRSFEDEITFVFRENAPTAIYRRQRKAKGALVYTGNLKSSRTMLALERPHDRALYVAAVEATGALGWYDPSNLRPYFEYLAGKVEAMGLAIDDEDKASWVKERLAHIEEVANGANRREKADCCPELGLLPWWDAMVRHGLEEHTNRITVSAESQQSESDAAAWVPAVSDERTLGVGAIGRAIGATAIGSTVGEELLRLGDEAAETLGFLLSHYLKGRREGVAPIEAAEYAIRHAGAHGHIESSRVDEVLACGDLASIRDALEATLAGRG